MTSHVAHGHSDSFRPAHQDLSLAAVTEQMKARPHSYVDVGHARLAYWKFGHGPDVVCVHGWPLSAVTFRRIVPALCRDFTLHLFDLPGTGHTEWTAASPIDIPGHVETLRRFLRKLELSRFALLAHDSGAAFARFVADSDPRVSALVLGNTEIPGHVPWLVRLYTAMASVPGLRELFVSSLRSRAIRHSLVAFGGCFADASYVDGEFAELFIHPLLRSPRAAAGQLELARTLDFDEFGRLGDIHSRIAAPVRLVWGSDDPFFPVQKARAMVRQFPHAELVEIPGAKLLAHEDFADTFASLAREHLLAHP